MPMPSGSASDQQQAGGPGEPVPAAAEHDDAEQDPADDADQEADQQQRVAEGDLAAADADRGHLDAVAEGHGPDPDRRDDDARGPDLPASAPSARRSATRPTTISAGGSTAKIQYEAATATKRERAGLDVVDGDHAPRDREQGPEGAADQSCGGGCGKRLSSTWDVPSSEVSLSTTTVLRTVSRETGSAITS